MGGRYPMGGVGLFMGLLLYKIVEATAWRRGNLAVGTGAGAPQGPPAP